MVSETRYHRIDLVLGTTQTVPYNTYGSSSKDVYLGTLVGLNGDVNGGLSGGLCVGVVQPGKTGGYQSATWACPFTPLSPTDYVTVRPQICDKAGNPTGDLGISWDTEPLGAQSLDAAIWTFYYYCWRVAPYTYLSYGSPSYNTRIENFTYTIYVPPVTVMIGNGKVYVT